MTRAILIIIVMVSLVINIAPFAYAENAITKFSRGLCNMVTFHFEIGEQSKRIKEAHGSVAGMTYGIGKGIVMAVVRAGVGAYEIVTAPIPFPKNYEPILKDPISFFPQPKKQ